MDRSEKPFNLLMVNQTSLAECPKCGSRHCQLRTTAQKTGVVVGGVLGAIIAAGLSGATTGAVIGASIATEESRRSIDLIMGTIGGAMVGFAWGAIAGYTVGAEIDRNVLRIHQCLKCGSEFRT
jgi:predicted nucleic-acid-binding Zn-ribbon protein